MLERNQVLELFIERLGDEAQGIGYHQGMVVFVPKALPGERVRARVIKPGKRYAVARLEAVELPSPERVEPPCLYAARCGGCVAQHMRYEATLAFKRQQVIDALARIGGIEQVEVLPMLGMDEPWRYRNKGAFPVGGVAGMPLIGCYAPRSHTIIDAPQGCLLQTEASDRLVEAVRLWMLRYAIEPYQEATHRGLVRHVVTRVTRAGEALLALVINGHAIPYERELIQDARQAYPGLAGVCISPHQERSNVIFGERCLCLWGEEDLRENHLGLTFSLSPRAFFQVNTPQAERLYQKALDYAALSDVERVADVYCGTGTMTLLLARHAAEAIGIEWSADAVANAQRNAQRNGLANARFICEDATRALPELVRSSGLDVVVVDPPRKGCHPSVLEAIGAARAKRLVYISCDPATLARDAALLKTHGYNLVQAQPVDMFCWTGGVETVALFLP